jgi:Zn-dependent M28 family amino/carboxypeptidase
MQRLVALTFLTVACQKAPPAKEVDGQLALTYAKTQVDFGPRIPGTEGHRRTAAWLDSLLRTKADTLVVQSWTHVSKRGDSVELKNFIGRFRPAASRRLLFLAHWDTRPEADADTGARAQQPVPGANDGASGVAVLLAMADVLHQAPPNVGVDLLLVDAEDYGVFSEEVDVLLGSKYYAAHQLPGPKPEFAVLLDMVGGTGARFQKEGNSVTGAPDVVDLVWDMAARLGYASHFLNETGGSITDDHTPLQQAGIRAIDIIPQISAAYPPWHTIDDTIDKLSPETLKAVGDVMVALVRSRK